jgi:hypothetical protein
MPVWRLGAGIVGELTGVGLGGVMEGRRLVIVDPCWSGPVGHHHDLNHTLLAELAPAGWRPEVWADAAIKEGPGVRAVFQDCGYEDPRHWADVAGTLHLARRLEAQLGAAAGEDPVAAWVVHTALPFQLLGLARWLQRQPPAVVAVSLMFAPGETLEGPPGDPQATAHCRLALVGLGQACRAAGHRPWIGVPTRQQGELLAPLLAAAGLPAGEVHPAVVGAGGAPVGPAGAPAVLLHWGDLKGGKGRQEALAVVAALLDQGVPPPLGGLAWLFHLHSREPLPAEERALLERAQQEISGFTLLQGPVPREAMLERLAACRLALLAYDPHAYAQRSSGMLWTWASARLAAGEPAAGVGYGEGWLAREAPALGVGWRGLAAGPRQPIGAQWLGALGESLTAAEGAPGFTAYGRAVLGGSFAAHLVSTVLASDR